MLEDSIRQVWRELHKKIGHTGCIKAGRNFGFYKKDELPVYFSE